MKDNGLYPKILQRTGIENSDNELVTKFKNGDSSSFVTLVDRHKKGLFRMFYRSLRNPAEAEDLTQEVFLKVYANLQNFRGDSSFKTWLYRIAVNMISNYKRSGRVTREILDDDTLIQNQSTDPEIIDESLFFMLLFFWFLFFEWRTCNTINETKIGG